MTGFRVSTSEVATFLTCGQRWMYAHHPSYHLEPRTLGIALSRGVVGHEALEIYYKAIQEGSSEDEARELVNSYIVRQSLTALTKGDPDKGLMISSLGTILKSYFDAHLWLFDKYTIIGVEHLVTAPLPGTDIEFAGRVDLLLEVNAGKQRGETVVWDHKFLYNFWPELTVKMNPQIPNYIWALREMGFHARSGNFNFIRYREDAIEGFKQPLIETTSTLRETFINNHTEAAKLIVDLKSKKTVGLKDGVKRSSSQFNCKYCPFVDLCYTQACGHNTDTMVEARFRPNSYGYDSPLDVD